MPFPRFRTAAGNLSWRDRFTAMRSILPLGRWIWSSAAGLLVCSAIVRLARAFFPFASLWIARLILDKVVSHIIHRQPFDASIWRYVVLEFSLAATNEILLRLTTLIDSSLADTFGNELNIRIMRHALLLDLPNFENPDFQDKLERARRQASSRLTIVPSLLNATQDSLCMLFLSLGVATSAPWLVLALVLAILPALIGETHFTSLAYSILYRRTPQRRQLEYIRLLGASAQSAKEVKSFGLGHYLLKWYGNLSISLHHENLKLTRRRACSGAVLGVWSALVYYGAYSILISNALHGALSIGTLVFIVGIFARCRILIERIVSHFGDAADEAMMMKDLFDFFATEPANCISTRNLPPPRPIRAGIEFRRVSFIYPGSGFAVLKNVSFRLLPSERVGLVGDNGAGKTTIVKLLARLYDPTEGEILLDGVDLRDYDIAELRHEIAVVFQDFMRYDLSLRENIGFGRVEWLSEEARIISAAEKSLSRDIVDRMPLGYDQILGRRFDHGVDLSAGEWQKIALARAYLRDAQVIALDEPSACLDVRSEIASFERMLKLTSGKTAMLISHRFSTVRSTDRILVLGDGTIKEEGTHQELLALGGRYAMLFEMQAAGYR